MSEIQDFKSNLTDPNSRRFETFSYLPELSKEELRKQVEYIVGHGWQPAIEHVEPEHAIEHYWYMWKLPMFGETDVDTILAEAEKCHQEYPDDHVKLIGYDWRRQTQGMAMVIYRGDMSRA